MANSIETGVAIGSVYPQEWATRLQEALDYPTNWKEVADVVYTTSYIVNVPYMSAGFAAASLTRGTAYTFDDFTLTSDNITVSTSYVVPVYIDRADLAQCTYTSQMEMAGRQAAELNRQIEAAMLADHASWTNFDNAAIGGGAGNITVSSTNIDDIIRAIKREIRESNGQDLMYRDGCFIIWRPADFELLEAFVQANGFNLADLALKQGTLPGLRYMGMDHYVSNSHTAGHLFGGVKRVEQIGLLSSTYGQIVFTNEPNQQSGVSYTARIDYGLNAKAGHTALAFDILVN